MKTSTARTITTTGGAASSTFTLHEPLVFHAHTQITRDAMCRLFKAEIVAGNIQHDRNSIDVESDVSKGNV